ncbi:PLP-dependent aminotransferase family protein [Nocardia sp. NPDC020380]|uniref:PLP-dependent aminotransferase family protein n=1 Tax=Nocardia sp. NPDC020380 TaxID=3364309 RepID=UPI0037B9EE2A
MADPRPPLGPELLLELPARGSRRRALEEALRTAIRDGRLLTGTRLPSTRDLATQLGLSRGTVTAAYEQLVAEGWLTARHGAGTTVAGSTATATATATATSVGLTTAAGHVASTVPRGTAVNRRTENGDSAAGTAVAAGRGSNAHREIAARTEVAGDVTGDRASHSPTAGRETTADRSAAAHTTTAENSATNGHTAVTGRSAASGVPWGSRGASSGAPVDVRFDLRSGRPDTQAFPRNAWARAMRLALRDAPGEAFGFGDPRGRIELRSTLAAYLGRSRGVRVDPENLVICSGYTQGLGLLVEAFTELGLTTVGMEDPSIPDHVELAAARMRVADVPLDDSGLSIEALCASAAEIAVCTPSHQFPIGVAMQPERRAALLDWAEERGGRIVEDDYDGEFRYDRKPIAALQSRRPDRIVYVGSTSKTIGPAVRLGWIACPPALLEPVLAAKIRSRDWRHLDQLAFAHLIDTGDYDRHLRTVRRSYHHRRDLLVAAIRNTLPHSRIRGIDAGLHAILELPAGLGEQEALAELRRSAVRAQPLGDYLRGDRTHYPPALVIGYGTPPERLYPEALEALLGTLARITGAK